MISATYGVFSDKDCTNQLATFTTDSNGNTETVEVKAGTVYIKELSAPTGYKVDNTVYSLKVEVGKTATLQDVRSIFARQPTVLKGKRDYYLFRCDWLCIV